MKKKHIKTNKKLNVWILQTGEPLAIDGKNLRYMRGMNLASKLIERGHNVVFFSSNFNHQKKIHRYKKSKFIKHSTNLSFHLIDSPGYNKNVSLRRFYDHIIMARNLKKIINQKIKKPDIVFIGYPPIETSYVMSKWLYSKNIPYVVDVKDQWPDLILEIFPRNFRFFFKLMLYPYFYCAKFLIKRAATITSMTSSYISWAEKISGKKIKNYSILPLVSDNNKINKTELRSTNKWCDVNEIKKNYFNILFIGSISNAFNFDTLINCAKKIKNKKIKFIICGDGEHKDKLKKSVKNLNNIVFLGWVDKYKFISLAKRCKIAIAPYKNIKNFQDNIPNKIIDYLSLGLPILSSLNGEVKSLLYKNKVGYAYDENSILSLKKQIYKMYKNKNTLSLASKEAKKIHKKYFNYDLIYNKTANLLEALYFQYKKN